MTAIIDLTDSPTRPMDAGKPTAIEVLPGAAPVSPELLWLIGRVGLVGLLATNAIYAFVAPESFENMLSTHFFLGWLPAPLITVLVAAAGVNDALLAIVVLARHRRPLVWAWVGVWFAVVALVKLTALV